ncbi:MAG: hypothetical protein KFF72_05565 [Arthrospira sp. SH-MAG29]|nr:hypothetical protein [Arthrospira sp. SH-MAG29]MBS0015821.1 hypothetical protein [Arthrospira sp. SH-MAG29]
MMLMLYAQAIACFQKPGFFKQPGFLISGGTPTRRYAIAHSVVRASWLYR